MQLIVDNWGLVGWALTGTELVVGGLLVVGALTRLVALIDLGQALFLALVFATRNRWAFEQPHEYVPLIILAIVPSGRVWGSTPSSGGGVAAMPGSCAVGRSELPRSPCTLGRADVVALEPAGPVVTVDVVLPCPDEAAALPWVLHRMPPGYRSIVADNGSTDGSADVARAHGPWMPKDTPYAGVASLWRSALARGERPRVFEDGGQLRDFVHVSDVARANALALVAGGPDVLTAFNVASGHPVTVLDVARGLSAASGPVPVVTGEYRLGDVRHVVASPERARAVLGFTARVTPTRLGGVRLRPAAGPRAAVDMTRCPLDVDRASTRRRPLSFAEPLPTVRARCADPSSSGARPSASRPLRGPFVVEESGVTQLEDAPRRTANTAPFAPLAPQEISQASAALRAHPGFSSSVRFVSVALQEPPKEKVLAGEDCDREAFAVLYDRGSSQTVEAVVSLDRGEVLTWTPIPGVQPSVMLEEFFAAEDITRQDPRWQEAVRKRGVEDFSLAMLDPWATGYDTECAPGRRLIKPLTFIRSKPDDNGYARPVEGLIVVIDLDRMEVVDVQDHGVVPLPPTPGNYMPELMVEPGNWPTFDRLREDVKPIEITQPQGASFTVDGHQVTWQKWTLGVGFSPREGLVLHQISYDDRGRQRPVVYRASLSEMYIPYGDPAPTHRFKNVFDEGEYGVGFLLNPLQLGCDCLGEIFYFDAAVNDNDGNPLTIPNAICMHEEDFGVAWKHTDFRTEKVEVRRSRRLVISCFATVGNYEYGFFWYLYNDGNIEFEVKLSGVISTGAVAPGETPAYGTVVAPGLYGPHHQHFFNVRLDMSVDGQRNSVHEVNSEGLPKGPGNETGNAWIARKTLIERESDGARLADPLRGRYWTISNPDVLNGTGQPVAYTLQPGESTLPMQAEGSHQGWERAGFAYKHLWVTHYDASERYASGDYPNQSAGMDGLPKYVQADRPVAGEDLVVWYSFSAHHVVRPEDWPVMPVARVGFHLKPSGFFDGNPALDLPRSEPACHTTASGDGHCG